VFDDVKVARENLSCSGSGAGELRRHLHARGALFATYARADDRRAFPKLPSRQACGRRQDLVVFKRIVNDGEILGTVYLRADYELFSRGLRLPRDRAVVLIAAMLVALLMSVMQNIVTRPILAIAQNRPRGGRAARLFARAAKMSADEGGTLVDSFNDMLAEIDRRTGAGGSNAKARAGGRGSAAAPNGRCCASTPSSRTG